MDHCLAANLNTQKQKQEWEEDVGQVLQEDAKLNIQTATRCIFASVRKNLMHLNYFHGIYFTPVREILKIKPSMNV